MMSSLLENLQNSFSKHGFISRRAKKWWYVVSEDTQPGVHDGVLHI